ncbi:MAG TPA: hypothetical protein EYP04_10380 [Anaerolineae bacterium]|nr:hypothetical protein [Anaerolineae bacterium]
MAQSPLAVLTKPLLAVATPTRLGGMPGTRRSPVTPLTARVRVTPSVVPRKLVAGLVPALPVRL